MSQIMVTYKSLHEQKFKHFFIHELNIDIFQLTNRRKKGSDAQYGYVFSDFFLETILHAVYSGKEHLTLFNSSHHSRVPRNSRIIYSI